MNTDTLTYGPHLSETTAFDWDEAVTTIVLDPASTEAPSDEDSIDGVELADGEPTGEIAAETPAEAAPAKPKRIRKPKAKVVTEMAAEAVSEAKPKRAPKAKAKAAPKAKAKAAPKAKAAEAAPTVEDLPEGRDRTHERHGNFAGQNDFGRTRLSKAASSDRLWTDLLTTGEVRVSLSSEVRNIRKHATHEMTPAQLDAAARNRIGQVLTQPYQNWYATAGKGSGVFKFEVEGTGATRALVITYADKTRPPLLISPQSQRPTKVGKIAAAMYSPGMRFQCGVKVADVKAVLAKMDDK